MTLAEGKVNKQRQASNRKLAAAVFVGAMGKMVGMSGKTRYGWKNPERPDMVGKTRMVGKPRNAWKIRKLLPTLNSRYASILA